MQRRGGWRWPRKSISGRRTLWRGTRTESSGGISGIVVARARAGGQQAKSIRRGAAWAVGS